MPQPKPDSPGPALAQPFEDGAKLVGLTSNSPRTAVRSGTIALRIVIGYVIFAAAWIAFSDGALAFFVSDKKLLLEISILKGWLFVGITSAILYALLRRQFVRLDREIAERASAEAAVHANDQRYRYLFENMRSGVSHCRMCYEGTRPTDFVYLAVNKAFENLTGLRDVVGKPVSEVIPGVVNLDPSIFEIYGRVARTGVSESFESYVKALGQWYSVSAYCPTPGEFVAVFEVVTERKRAEQSLNVLSKSVEQCPIPIVITNPAAEIEYVNAKFLESTGYSLAEIIGRNPRMLQSGNTSRETYKQLWDTITGGIEWHGEIQNRKKNGELFWERATIFPIREEGLGITHFVAFKEDVTERKKLEEQFLRSQRLESLGMLAAGIAHDLNNILAPISMATPLLRMNAKDRDDIEMLDMLDSSSKRGTALVRQILGFAHGLGGEMRLVQVKHLLHDIIGFISETFPKAISLEAVVPNDLWPVMANSTQIHQVLLNLSVNARDAMPKGGVLRLKAVNQTLDDAMAASIKGASVGNWLMLQVEDNGVGISPEILSKIWEPFFSTKAADKGTGLGLSTVRGIIRNHGGFLSLDSAVGSGTVVRVYLPAALNAPQGEVGLSKTSPGRGRNQLILFADDEEPIRRAASNILTNSGYRVVAVADGAEALKALEKEGGDIALLITDIDMPNLDGEQLSRRVRMLRPRLKIITMSGVGTPTEDLKFQEYSDAFIPKPFTAELLLDMVQKFANSASNGRP